MKSKQLNELQIAAKLKAGKPFSVSTKREQNIALMVAKAFGINITTRSRDGVFNILFF